MNARVFCSCGHDVGCHAMGNPLGRCLLQNADGSECACSACAPATVHVGPSTDVYRLVPSEQRVDYPTVEAREAAMLGAHGDGQIDGLQKAWLIAHEVAEASDGERRLGALSVAGKIHNVLTLCGAPVPDDPCTANPKADKSNA